MKKVYEKPAMYVENFSLSQSIATACGVDSKDGNTLGRPAHGDKDTCGWDMGNLVVWNMGTTSNCSFPGGDVYEGVCYNNPNGGTQIFAS